MTDDRNATPGAAPPPQAPPPIPAQPPYAPESPRPAAAAYARQTPWGWIVAAVLAAVLITLVCLYFFTDLLSREPRDSWDDSDSSFSQSGTGSQGSLGSSSSAQRPYQPAPAPMPAPAPSTGTGSGYAPTVSWLQGTWGPSCPASRAQVVTFYGGGRFTADGGEGTWTLDGENVTLVVSGRTMLTRWEYLAPDIARVTQVAGGRTRTVQRCP